MNHNNGLTKNISAEALVQSSLNGHLGKDSLVTSISTVRKSHNFLENYHSLEFSLE